VSVRRWLACEKCGDPFETRVATARHCSEKCRRAAQKQRARARKRIAGADAQVRTQGGSVSPDQADAEQGVALRESAVHELRRQRPDARLWDAQMAVDAAWATEMTINDVLDKIGFPYLKRGLPTVATLVKDSVRLLVTTGMISGQPFPQGEGLDRLGEWRA
jgi:hypothetical protein